MIRIMLRRRHEGAAHARVDEGSEDIGHFGFDIYGRTVGSRPRDAAAAVIERIFTPTAKRLQRYLERNG
jgi:hypothetical protein